MTEQVRVHVDLPGGPLACGTLSVNRGRTLTSTFAYDPAYLAEPRAHAIEPALSLMGGKFHAQGLPGSVGDAAPDRWGRNLVRKRLRATGELVGREVSELDFLLGVSDETRQGALRFSIGNGPFLAEHTDVPRLVALPRLLRASERVALDDDDAREVKLLLDAGTASLGGARPKASVRDGHILHLAKFPHPGDEWDVMAWEATALDLAERAGIAVPARRLLKVDGRSVLLLERFDRQGVQRVGYISAMTLLGASDGDERDYLEIAEALALNSAHPSDDLAQLWRRIAFGLFVNNTDDHLRNHGLLRAANGWRLSPAFDLNPNPERAEHATSIVGESDGRGGLSALMDTAGQFALTDAAAAQGLEEVRAAVGSWEEVAASHGVRPAELRLMREAFSLASGSTD